MMIKGTIVTWAGREYFINGKFMRVPVGTTLKGCPKCNESWMLEHSRLCTPCHTKVEMNPLPTSGTVGFSFTGNFIDNAKKYKMGHCIIPDIEIQHEPLFPNDDPMADVLKTVAKYGDILEDNLDEEELLKLWNSMKMNKKVNKD